MLFLGMDNDVEFDPETGEIDDTFNGAAVTLNGHTVSLFFDGEGEEFANYSIPAKINGREMDILVLYNFETDQAEILGGWPGIDPVSHMAAKERIKIKDGDRITPLFMYYDEATDTDGLEEGPTFVVQGGLKLGVTDLPPGEYLYGFYMIDLARNEAFSDFTLVEVSGEDPAPPMIGTPAQPAPAGPSDEIKVLLAGRKLEFDVPPVIREGRTLVPLRAIFEALGAQVGYEATTRVVTATKGDITVHLQIDNPVVRRNGQDVTLTVAPTVTNGRTLVPLRFVSEALGATVDFDGATRTITITPAP